MTAYSRWGKFLHRLFDISGIITTLQTVMEAPFDVEVIIDEHTILTNNYGRTDNKISHPEGNTE